MKYANRARNIRNKPVINRDPQSVMLNQLRQEIRVRMWLLCAKPDVVCNLYQLSVPKTSMPNLTKFRYQALQVELLNQRMRSMGLEPVNGPQCLEVLLQDESHREFLADIR